MFNEKFLFGFLNLGDDMLFPDYESYQDVTISKISSHILTQDSFIVAIQKQDDEAADLCGLRVNGTQVIPQTYTFAVFPFFASKGDTISLVAQYNNRYSVLRIFPLTRKGGGIRDISLLLALLQEPQHE